MVATRPIARNGLGMRLSDVPVQFELLKRFFAVLPETEDIFPAWERLVTQYRVAGKPAHDARLVAAMQVHGVPAPSSAACRSAQAAARHRRFRTAELVELLGEASRGFAPRRCAMRTRG